MAEKKETKNVKEKAAEVKESVKAVPARAKAAVKKAEDKAVAVKIEAKKTARKAAGAAKETKEKVSKAVKAPAAKAKAARMEIFIQSPMGGNITPEEIAAKLPQGVDSVFVRVDQNKLWWIRGDETGSVDIWD